jgi:tetratricopeptide (TPR) repeat protein
VHHWPPRWRLGAALALLTCLCTGCAGRPARNRFIARTGSGPIEILAGQAPAVKALSTDAIRKAEVAARAARGPAPVVATIELRNSALRGALSSLRSDPTALAYLHVAEEYRRAGVLDQACDYFDEALRRDPRLAAAYDGRARVWRDWYIPAAGLGDSARAVYYAPRSASAHNTQGTLLLAIGECAAARSAFQKAIDLDPAATYARINLQTVNQRRQDGQRCEPAQLTAGRSQVK